MLCKYSYTLNTNLIKTSTGLFINYGTKKIFSGKRKTWNILEAMQSGLVLLDIQTYVEATAFKCDSDSRIENKQIKESQDIDPTMYRNMI